MRVEGRDKKAIGRSVKRLRYGKILPKGGGSRRKGRKGQQTIE